MISTSADILGMDKDQILLKCTSCNTEKCIAEFYVRSETGKPRPICKRCHNKKCSDNVVKWRRNAKLRLVTEFGSSCMDCGYTGPPFMFDFDHRDPEKKEFGIARAGNTRAYARMKAEAEKCDLVCANCHRFRTHKQRCTGCEYCGCITSR